jgi:hypothetical protein
MVLYQPLRRRGMPAVRLLTGTSGATAHVLARSTQSPLLSCVMCPVACYTRCWANLARLACLPDAMAGWVTVVCATASATADDEPPSVAALATAVAAASELLLKVSARLCALALALPPLLRPWYNVLAGPVVGGAMVCLGTLRRL